MRLSQIDFSVDNTRRSLARSVVPLLVADVLSLLYSIVDRMYIGRIAGEGPAGLAGIGLCFPFVMMVTAFTVLFGQGGSPLCAMERGRKNPQKAGEIMSTAYTLLLLASAALFVLFEAFAAPLLRAFGASRELLPHALRYLRLYLLGTPATMIASGLQPFILAQGFASPGMLSIAIGAGLNILLDPVLIFGFGLGVRGAAAATVIAQWASAVYVLRFLRGRNSELRLSLLRPSRLNGAIVTDIFGLGIVNFIMQFTNSLVAVVCNRMLAGYGGDLYISVYTVISSVRQILDVPVSAIGGGASPLLSYHYGAGRMDRMRETVRLFTGWGVAYTACVWGLILLFPQLFIRAITSDREVVLACAPALRIYFMTFVFQALQYSGQTVFRSIGRKRQAIFFSLFRKVVMVVPLTLLLPSLGFGANGVFLAEPISNLIGGGACYATMFFTEYRRWQVSGARGATEKRL